MYYSREYLEYIKKIEEIKRKDAERHLNPDIENFFFNLVKDLNKKFPKGVFHIDLDKG